jgi:hypothetical protein
MRILKKYRAAVFSGRLVHNSWRERPTKLVLKLHS